MKALAVALVLISLSAHAVPPAPPAPPMIINKIRSSIARNCTTDNGGITVSDLKDTDKVKFVLQLDSKNEKGVLTVLDSGEVMQNFTVTCNK